MENPDLQGGYPIPDNIALVLLRFVLLCKLSSLFDLGRVYWIDKEGIRVKSINLPETSKGE